MLDLIATRLGINWEYNASKGVIRFYRLTTKMWQLPMKAGTSSFTTEFKQSAQGGSNANVGGGGQATQIDAAVKSEAKELDDMDGIRKSIEPALTIVGRAELNPATGILTLKDTKEAVEAADEIVRKQVAIYSRMVYVKFQTIDFTVTDNGEAGADWNAVLTKALEHIPSFTFTALSPASIVSSTPAVSGSGSRRADGMARRRSSTRSSSTARSRPPSRFRWRCATATALNTTTGGSSPMCRRRRQLRRRLVARVAFPALPPRPAPLVSSSPCSQTRPPATT